MINRLWINWMLICARSYPSVSFRICFWKSSEVVCRWISCSAAACTRRSSSCIRSSCRSSWLTSSSRRVTACWSFLPPPLQLVVRLNTAVIPIFATSTADGGGWILAQYQPRRFRLIQRLRREKAKHLLRQIGAAAAGVAHSSAGAPPAHRWHLAVGRNSPGAAAVIPAVTTTMLLLVRVMIN